MKDYHSKLCMLLLEEYFGSIVQCIGNSLLYGTKSLTIIKLDTQLPLIKVKEGLCVLIKFGFVTYQHNERDIQYTLNCNKIIILLRYPRYMLFAKTYCGDEGEIMFEEVLKHGYITASEVIIKTYKRIEETHSKCTEQVSIENLKNTFELLVKNQFLMHSTSFNTTAKNTKKPNNLPCLDLTDQVLMHSTSFNTAKNSKKPNYNLPCLDSTNQVLMRSTSFNTTAESTEKPNYDLPCLDLTAISKMLQGQNANPGDNELYWQVNFDRFTQDFRDKIVISAMTERFDKNAGELMRQLINLMYLRTASWEATSNPIPYTEIKEEIKKLNYSELEQYLAEYLRLIEEDSSQFIKRVGDSGGGQYSINMKNAFKQLVWTTIESIVTERFGSKAARIFRLVRIKKNVNLDQIQQLAMIPAKEAKCLTYILVQENFIQMQEVKKIGTWTAPTKGPFHFYIDLTKVVQMEIEHCCQALYNIIKRRDHELSSNKRMIEKQLRVQILSTNMKEHGATEQQLADVAEMMTPSETQQLEKAQNAIKKLNGTELQIDETLFLLTMYFRYH